MRNSRFLPLLVFAVVSFSWDVGAQVPALVSTESAQRLPQAAPVVPPLNLVELRLKRELHQTKVEAASQQARADELARAKETSDTQVTDHLKVVERLTADNATLAKELEKARSFRPAYEQQNETIKLSLDSFKQMVVGLIAVMLVLGLVCILSLIAALSSRRGLVRAMAEAFEEEQLRKKDEEITVFRRRLAEAEEKARGQEDEMRVLRRAGDTVRSLRTEITELQTRRSTDNERIRNLEDAMRGQTVLLTNARETLTLAGVEVGADFLPVIASNPVSDADSRSENPMIAAPQDEDPTVPQPPATELLVEAGGDPQRGTVQAMVAVGDDKDGPGSPIGTDENEA